VDPWRPDDLTPEVADLIIGSVRANDYLETAAARAGVSIGTVRLWARDGARIARRCQKYPEDIKGLTDLERRKVDFSAGILRAKAEAEHDGQANIGRAGSVHSVETKRTRKIIGTYEDDEGKPVAVYAEEVTVTEKPPDWRATAWRQERRFPTRWGQVTRNEHSGPGGGPIPVELQVEGLMAKWAAARDEAVDDRPELGAGGDVIDVAEVDRE